MSRNALKLKPCRNEALRRAAPAPSAAAWDVFSQMIPRGRAAEIDARHEQTARLNVRFSKLPYIKRLDTFDFAAQPSVDRRMIDELATGRFHSVIHLESHYPAHADGRNLVLLGPPGVGKTHLAIALGVMTAEIGHRIYFTTAIEMVRRLSKAMKESYLPREIKNLVRPTLLIIDEVGYLTLDRPQASLLFQVICHRYEREGSIILRATKHSLNGMTSLPATPSLPQPLSIVYCIARP